MRDVDEGGKTEMKRAQLLEEVVTADLETPGSVALYYGSGNGSGSNHFLSPSSINDTRN